jgi:hypothetical protein
VELPNLESIMKEVPAAAEGTPPAVPGETPPPALKPITSYGEEWERKKGGYLEK